MIEVDHLTFMDAGIHSLNLRFAKTRRYTGCRLRHFHKMGNFFYWLKWTNA